MRRRRRSRCRKRLRWPWLWWLAIAFAAAQLFAFAAGWSLSVIYLAPLVAGLWMGCCCRTDCGPCCRDRGCVSEFVECRIIDVAGDDGPYSCSTTCSVNFVNWATMTESASEPECSWHQLRDCTESLEADYGTEDGVVLRFAQARYDCSQPPNVESTPGNCWLTMLVTGDSTTSGFGGGHWIAVWEKLIPGPYPTDCEGMHDLTFKCQSADCPCDFSLSTAQVNLVFNGACDPTATFDPWADDVDFAIESDCPDIDGTTDTLINDADLDSEPPTQIWTDDGTPIGIAGMIAFDAVLAWDHNSCEYKLTLTQNGVTSCRLVGGSQTIAATLTNCSPFELLFEGFELEDDPVAGPCECATPAFFDVRITEP